MRNTIRNIVNEVADLHGGVWGEHPAYPVKDWQYSVANDETRNSYWLWVVANMEMNGDKLPE